MHENREQYVNLREGKESTLTTQQIQKLNDLGFEWGKMKKINRTFDERLSELKAYKEQNGKRTHEQTIKLKLYNLTCIFDEC